AVCMVQGNKGRECPPAAGWRLLGVAPADVEPEHGPRHRSSISSRSLVLGVLCAGQASAGSGPHLIGAGSRGSAPGGSAVSGGPGTATGRIGPEPGAGVHVGPGPLVVGTVAGGVLGGARCEAILDRRRSLRGASPRRPTRTQTRVKLPSAGITLARSSRAMGLLGPAVRRVVILPLLPSFSLDTRGKPSSCSAFC